MSAILTSFKIPCLHCLHFFLRPLTLSPCWASAWCLLSSKLLLVPQDLHKQPFLCSLPAWTALPPHPKGSLLFFVLPFLQTVEFCGHREAEASGYGMALWAWPYISTRIIGKEGVKQTPPLPTVFSCCIVVGGPKQAGSAQGSLSGRTTEHGYSLSSHKDGAPEAKPPTTISMFPGSKLIKMSFPLLCHLLIPHVCTL